MKTPYDARIDRLKRNERYSTAIALLLHQRDGYLAALQSPEVTALRKALEIANGLLEAEFGKGYHLQDLIRDALAPWKDESLSERTRAEGDRSDRP